MHFIGLDLGTTHIKAARFDLGDVPRMTAAHAEPAALLTGTPGRAEQDPYQVLAAARRALDAVGPASSIGVSAAMHSLLLLDVDDTPLGPALTWADQRAAPQAERLRANGEGPVLTARSGTPVHAMSPFCKLLWMREEAPELLQRVARVSGLKEFVLARLCGIPCDFMDRSMASATGLLDIAKGTWDEALLARVGVSREGMPRIVETTAVLAPGWVAGAGDGPLSNLGCGAVQGGRAALTLGTSGAIRTCTTGPAAEGDGRTFCYHLMQDMWVRGGAITSGGIVLDWTASMLGVGSAAAVLALAAEAPAGADGVVMVPYLAGERAPHWDAEARAAIHGLRLHHRPHHLARAAVEATAFAVRDVLEALPDVVSLTATGGFTRSSFWVQTVADICKRPLSISSIPEAAALGAALLAARAVGEVRVGGDMNAMAARLAAVQSVRHEPSPQAVYDERFDAYRALYAATRTIR